MSCIILDNALVTGGSGMIGNYIDFGYRPSSKEMNITDLNSIQKYINKYTITCIIHMAAINLRECDNDKKKAININCVF